MVVSNCERRVPLERHTFDAPSPSDSRSPCPALNALANHGYLARDGRNIKFWTLVSVVAHVFNITYPLAILLAFVGYLTCGKLSFARSTYIPATSPRNRSFLGSILHTFSSAFRPFRPQWTLDLCALQKRSFYCITHDASLAHCDGKPSCSPDRNLVTELVSYGRTAHRHDPGLSLPDFAQLHARRAYQVAMSGHRLSNFHEQVSLGECALAWLVLRTRWNPTLPATRVPKSTDRRLSSTGARDRMLVDDVAPISRILQLFGEERLPDGWWDDPAEGGTRPQSPITFSQARVFANYVGKLGM